jgi:hypothetical protein
MQELATQGIEDYELWQGLILPSIKESINRSHKMIVEYASVAGWEEICIGEDDLKFSSPGAWEYFSKQKPNDFDIYSGGIFLGSPDKDGVVKNFTGMSLYIISQKFYETFLSVPDDDHIDRMLDGLGRYVVCQPFVVTQYDGISSNTGKFEKYGDLQKNREFYKG